MERPIITLLTDFGLRDHFVGVIKGVILGICPDAAVVDITHSLAPQEVSEAAFVLSCAYGHFPPGAVHLAVVDPGVGGARRSLAARCGEHLFVAPDNGILSYPLAEQADCRVVEITNPRCRLPRVSRTFHGRDIFAPAAAHLALGVPLEDLGRVVADPVRLKLAAPRETTAGLEAHVLHIDAFGDLMTDLKEERFAQWLGDSPPGEVTVVAGETHIEGISESYEAVAPGRPVAIMGSAGRLELAVNRGRANQVLRLERGDTIWLRKPS